MHYIQISQDHHSHVPALSSTPKAGGIYRWRLSIGVWSKSLKSQSCFHGRNSTCLAQWECEEWWKVIRWALPVNWRKGYLAEGGWPHEEAIISISIFIFILYDHIGIINSFSKQNLEYQQYHLLACDLKLKKVSSRVLCIVMVWVDISFITYLQNISNEIWVPQQSYNQKYTATLTGKKWKGAKEKKSKFCHILIPRYLTDL